jgi:cell division protein FtsW
MTATRTPPTQAQRARMAQQAKAAEARAARMPQAAPQTPAQPRQRPTVAVVPVKRIFTVARTDYFLLLGVTLFLVIFGLVMVLSSSTIESFSDDDGFFGRFARQGLFAVVGIPLMLIASRMPPTFWKRWAPQFLLLGGALQMLVFVPGIGFGYGGNNNWIHIGDFSAQPSEFVKVALIVWIASVMAVRQDSLEEWRRVALPIAPIAGIAIGLVMIGKDLGTASVMVMIVLGCLYFAGVRMKHLFVASIGVGLLALFFSSIGSSRSSRIDSWLSGCADPSVAECWQPLHAMWALAAGGLFGKGLGNSVAKWNWLPEASSDYIFAIIGEELGLIGAVVVLALFVVLAISFIRILRSARDPFARIVTGGVMVWVIGQAFVNIAVVLGVLPVLGVPLPLISAGGSALIATLLGIGVVLSFARTNSAEPRDDVVQSPADRSRLLAEQRVRSRG